LRKGETFNLIFFCKIKNPWEKKKGEESNWPGSVGDLSGGGKKGGGSVRSSTVHTDAKGFRGKEGKRGGSAEPPPPPRLFCPPRDQGGGGGMISPAGILLLFLEKGKGRAGSFACSKRKKKGASFGFCVIFPAGRRGACRASAFRLLKKKKKFVGDTSYFFRGGKG